MWRRIIFLSNDVIREKARRSLIDTNSSLLPSRHHQLYFSKGWLSLLKKRKKFKSHQSHGKDGDADEEAIRTNLPILIRLLSDFSPNDIIYGDEFGLFYGIAPTTTTEPAQLRGIKKKRIVLRSFYAETVTGPSAFFFWGVSRAQRLRCFKGKDGWDYRFDYCHMRKAWITRNLFFDWPIRFDTYISQTPQRRVILLIENASCHGQEENLSALNAVWVVFLPTNTSSRLQPVDDSVIDSIKRRFRRQKNSRAVDLAERGLNSGHYNMNVFAAISTI